MTNAGGPYKPNKVPKPGKITKICTQCRGLGITGTNMAKKCPICQGSGRIPR